MPQRKHNNAFPLVALAASNPLAAPMPPAGVGARDLRCAAFPERHFFGLASPACGPSWTRIL